VDTKGETRKSYQGRRAQTLWDKRLGKETLSTLRYGGEHCGKLRCRGLLSGKTFSKAQIEIDDFLKLKEGRKRPGVF